MRTYPHAHRLFGAACLFAMVFLLPGPRPNLAQAALPAPAGPTDARFDSSPPHDWSLHFGGTADDYGQNLALDASGNTVISGNFRGTVDFGRGALASAGEADIFIAKYNRLGFPLWSRRMGSTLNDYSRALAIDATGNVLVGGEFRGTVDFGSVTLTSAGAADVFLARYKANGTPLWAKSLGNVQNEYLESLAIDASGNVFVGGAFQGTLDFGPLELTSAGSYDIFLAKYQADGTFVQAIRIGGAGSEHVRSLTVDAQGNLLLAGDFEGAVDFGDAVRTSAGDYDIFLAKYNAAAEPLWSRSLGAGNTDVGYSLGIDPSGNVFVTGFFVGTVNFGTKVCASAGGPDIFLAKYDANGSQLWAECFGGTGTDSGQSLVADAFGNVFVTGILSGVASLGGSDLTSAGSYDIFLAKYGSDGGHAWSKRFGGTGTDYGESLAATVSGSVSLTGVFQNTVSFGGDDLASAGGHDIFLARYSFRHIYLPLIPMTISVVP